MCESKGKQFVCKKDDDQYQIVQANRLSAKIMTQLTYFTLFCMGLPHTLHQFCIILTANSLSILF